MSKHDLVLGFVHGPIRADQTANRTVFTFDRPLMKVTAESPFCFLISGFTWKCGDPWLECNPLWQAARSCSNGIGDDPDPKSPQDDPRRWCSDLEFKKNHSTFSNIPE